MTRDQALEKHKKAWVCRYRRFYQCAEVYIRLDEEEEPLHKERGSEDDKRDEKKYRLKKRKTEQRLSLPD